MTAPLSHFARQEKVEHNTAPSVNDYLSIAVPPNLRERRLYVYLETIAGGAFIGQLTLLRSKSIIAEYPVEIGVPVIASSGRSTVSILNYGGTPVGDCLVINFLDPFTATASVTVQPLRVNLEIDEVKYETKNFVGSPTGWRVLLACISTRI